MRFFQDLMKCFGNDGKSSYSEEGIHLIPLKNLRNLTGKWRKLLRCLILRTIRIFCSEYSVNTMINYLLLSNS